MKPHEWKEEGTIIFDCEHCGTRKVTKDSWSKQFGESTVYKLRCVECGNLNYLKPHPTKIGVAYTIYIYKPKEKEEETVKQAEG